MRLRLGLLQDPAAIDRQIAKELADAEARRKRVLKEAAVPTVKTEAQAKRDDAIKEKERKKIEDELKKPPRIRPLSEAKAIETGANFISETFLFCVAGGIIVFEYFRNKRKDASRRGDVEDRLDELEKERDELLQKMQRLETTIAVKKPTETKVLAANSTEKPSPSTTTTAASPAETRQPLTPSEVPTLKRRDSEGRVVPDAKDKRPR
jgi:hypothetical protein